MLGVVRCGIEEVEITVLLSWVKVLFAIVLSGKEHTGATWSKLLLKASRPILDCVCVWLGDLVSRGVQQKRMNNPGSCGGSGSGYLAGALKCAVPASGRLHRLRDVLRCFYDALNVV